ncbi:unnamed protein product [Adineta steineri]|uniref:Uncharacterized protein n=1 Tax=Adineta steineri TaxID=433720 RepID=A0A818QEL4_9BILA|nr:unnamed protein product [Adineta steineri]
MNQNNKEIIHKKQVKPSNSNDIDIDVISSDNTQRKNHEIEELPSVLILNTESIDDVKNRIPIDSSSSVKTDDHVQKPVSKAVYDYATMFHQTMEESRQNRLNEDVTTILGSSDPPPGFGVLHPPVRYLKQKCPFPLDPLPVWRGYNGNVYFSPIQVQQLDSDRPRSLSKSLRSASTNSIPSTRKTDDGLSNGILSTYKTRKSFKERIDNDRRAHLQTVTNSKMITLNNEFKNRTSTNNRDNGQKSILKHNQHTTEDSIKHRRQVLPNIRSIPKPKFIHKGLAYKESERFSHFPNENDTDALQQSFNLTQAYAQYGINSTRTKQLPFISHAAPLTKDQQTSDVRETKKRIIKGTTTSYHIPTQSMALAPLPNDQNSDLFLSAQKTINPFNHISGSFTSSSYQQKHAAIYTTPNISQYFENFSTNNNLNIS